MKNFHREKEQAEDFDSLLNSFSWYLYELMYAYNNYHKMTFISALYSLTMYLMNNSVTC